MEGGLSMEEGKVGQTSRDHGGSKREAIRGRHELQHVYGGDCLAEWGVHSVLKHFSIFSFYLLFSSEQLIKNTGRKIVETFNRDAEPRNARSDQTCMAPKGSQNIPPARMAATKRGSAADRL